MQQIRLLLKQETRNNRSGARGFKKMGELVIKLAIGHWSKTSARYMGGVFQETSKPGGRI